MESLQLSFSRRENMNKSIRLGPQHLWFTDVENICYILLVFQYLEQSCGTVVPNPNPEPDQDHI